jgi:hypothetical protein
MKGWIKLNSNQISTNLMLSDLGRELETLINLQYKKTSNKLRCCVKYIACYNTCVCTYIVVMTSRSVRFTPIATSKTCSAK